MNESNRAFVGLPDYAGGINRCMLSGCKAVAPWKVYTYMRGCMRGWDSLPRHPRARMHRCTRSIKACISVNATPSIPSYMKENWWNKLQGKGYGAFCEALRSYQLHCRHMHRAKVVLPGEFSCKIAVFGCRAAAYPDQALMPLMGHALHASSCQKYVSGECYCLLQTNQIYFYCF